MESQKAGRRSTSSYRDYSEAREETNEGRSLSACPVLARATGVRSGKGNRLPMRSASSVVHVTDNAAATSTP